MEVSSFVFGFADDSADRRYLPPPKTHEKVFATLKLQPSTDEPSAAREYVERWLGVRNHFVRAESDFDYVYANAANGIRETRRAWVLSTDVTDGGTRKRIDFIIRFLPSPLYEVEKQIEYDAERRREAEKMKVVPVSEPSSEKKENTLTEEEIIRSYEKARRAAEQNSSVPPSVNGDMFDVAPVKIPVDEGDSIEKSMAKKAEKDKVRKEKEAMLVESLLRNKERIRGVAERG